VRKLDLISLLFVVCVSAVCLTFAAASVIKQKKQMAKENVLVSIGMKDLDSAEETLQDLKQALTDTKEELELIRRRVPEPGHMGEFVKQIHALMKLRKVKLISLQPLPPVKEEAYNRIPIRLLSVGSFTDIHHLLWDLETMDRVVVMEKIVISRPDINQRCQVSLTAIVFEQEKAVNRGP